MTTDHNNTTTKPHNLKFCPPFRTAILETLDSSIPYLVNAALNVPMAIPTIFTNLLVLLAMRHVDSIRIPSKLLLCSLVLTDLGAGLVVQPQFIALLFMKAINPHSIHICSLYHSYIFSGSLFSCASLLNMTAISLDRYAALFFYHEYQQIVTTRRVCAVLTFIWSFSLLFASSSSWSLALWLAIFFACLPICFLVVSVAYIKIYRRLRGQHEDDVPAEQQAGNTLNMARYKRTAFAMMWIYVLFIICNFPSLCVVLTSLAVGYTALTWCIRAFGYTVILLNSCLNPFVYCLRLPEVRSEVMKKLRQFCCRSPQQ